MPNKYSQPVQSQFVPTFVPFDPQVAQNIATGLQGRQQRGMESYDRLQEMFSQIESKALQQDKPLLQGQLENVRGNLDQIVADGDFTDVQPRIRKAATQLKENLRKGPLSKVVRSYENAQKSIEKIRDTDLSASEKDSLINTILSEYEGAIEGDMFPEFTPAESVDVNEKARQLIDDIPKETIKKDTGWSEQIYNEWVKRGKTFEGLPQSVVENYVKPSLQSDPKVMDYLNQRAYIQTAGLPPEQRKQKINQLTDEYLNQASQLARLGEGTEGRSFTDPFTGEQTTLWGSGTSEINLSEFAPTEARGSSSRIAVDTQGITNVKDVGLDGDLRGVLKDMKTFERRGEAENASILKSVVNNSLEAFRRDNEKEISTEDIKFMKQKGLAYKDFLDRYAEGADPGMISGRQRFPTQQEVETGQQQDLVPALSESEQERLQELFNKFSEWLEKEGGYTDRGIAPNTTTNEGRTAWRNIQDTITASIGSNPNMWNVMGKSGEEAVEYLKENMGSLTYLQTIAPNKYSPTIHRMRTEDGEVVNLVEKKDPMKRYDVTDAILDQLGTAGRRVKENRVLEEVPITNVQENHYENLPPVYQSSVPGNYLSFVSDEGGNINVTYGEENDQKKFTTGDFFHTQLKQYREGSVTPSQWEQLRERIITANQNSSDPLTEEEIQKMDDDPQSVAEALRQAFSDPYGFPDRVSAINHVIDLNR